MAYTETDGWYCFTHDVFESDASTFEQHIEDNKPCEYAKAFQAS